MRRILHLLCTVVFGMSAHGWSQTPFSVPPIPIGQAADDAPSGSSEPSQRPIRLPATETDSALPIDNLDTQGSGSSAWSGAFQIPTETIDLPGLSRIEDSAAPSDLLIQPNSNADVSNAFAFETETENQVRSIPTYVVPSTPAHRIVRYEVPLDDVALNQTFTDHGIEGQLIEVVDKAAQKDDSISDRIRAFLSPNESRRKAKKLRLVRYEVPADDIYFHAQMTDLDGQLLNPGMLRMPEVRFFQPKARVFMDLKRSNDGEFDLFNNGAILASLDVIELYFPMPLISERFAETFGRPGPLASLGWRVGGTFGLGIATALNNGSSSNGSAPVSTLSTGIRYEFPLGRPSRELLETGDGRLDQRTRVGMEFGLQGGISTREALKDSTDLGLYFGILVNTPWGS